MPPLVSARVCGDCTVCCKALPADAVDFKKQSGTLCKYCAEGRGCKIYQARPQVCRDFFCGWRYLRLLDDAWRPDRSGVLVMFETDDSCIPVGYPIRPAIKFLVLGGPSAVEQLKFVAYVNGIVNAGAPAFLAVPGPAGHYASKAFINDALAQAVAHNDGRAITRKLLELYAELARGVFEPIALPVATAPASPGRSFAPLARPPSAPLPLAPKAAPAQAIPLRPATLTPTPSTIAYPKTPPQEAAPPKPAPPPAEPPTIPFPESVAADPPLRRNGSVNYHVERSNGCADGAPIRRAGAVGASPLN